MCRVLYLSFSFNAFNFQLGTAHDEEEINFEFIYVIYSVHVSVSKTMPFISFKMDDCVVNAYRS